MKYMGSKNRIVKEILPIILNGRKTQQYYVEPFAGGMNVICDVDGNRIANDKNKYLIEMWKGILLNRDVCKIITKQLYDEVRTAYYNNDNSKFDDFTIGWVGWMGSANGRFFDGGYSGTITTKIGTTRDYIAEAIRNIEKQKDKVIGVELLSVDYRQLNVPEKSIIYCDPPYKNTKQYATSKDFNHTEFWGWCREQKSKGHSVYISEYVAPSDFRCVWEKKIKSSLSANGVCGGNKESVERLFSI